MSNVHFSIEAKNGVCTVTDLGSRMGTYVNEQRITARALESGDRIGAGQTLFRVVVEGGRPNNASSEQIRPIYDSQSCPSGLLLYCGTDDFPSPLSLARQIASRWPLFLLAGFDGRKLNLPERIARSGQRVPGHTNPEWAKFHPLLIAAGELPDPFAVIEEGWKQGGVACLFSKLPKPQLWASLCKHAPSYSGVDVLREQLARCPAGFVQQVTRNIPAILLPAADPAHWRLYGNPEHVRSWRELGFAAGPVNEEEDDVGIGDHPDPIGSRGLA
jgi:hypothetical protein